MNDRKQNLASGIVYVTMATHMLYSAIDMKPQDGWDCIGRLAMLFLAVVATCAATLLFKRAIEP